jgi:predicted DNA-binding transcriptional regulator YafY
VSQIERIYRIHRLLAEGRAPSLARLMERLEVSRATIKRDLDYLRDRLEAPLAFDRLAHGYRYVYQPGEPPYELPGLWFSAEEVHALLLLQELLEQLQSGVLQEPLKPLERRLRKLLDAMPGAAKELRHRVRLMSSPVRKVEPAHFRAVARATLERRRIEIRYFAKAKAERRLREVSPQRLLYYRSNWYVHGWCHFREDLRSFALDSMEFVRILETPAHEIDTAEVEAHIGAGYGMYSGPRRGVAVLEFTAEAARWVRAEVWHPEQTVTPLAGGGVRLEVPYAHIKEVELDVLRYGANVRVVAPAELRQSVAAALRQAAEQYGPVRRSPGRALTAG